MPDIPYWMYGKHTIQGMAGRGNLEVIKYKPRKTERDIYTGIYI